MASLGILAFPLLFLKTLSLRKHTSTWLFLHFLKEKFYKSKE